MYSDLFFSAQKDEMGMFSHFEVKMKIVLIFDARHKSLLQYDANDVFASQQSPVILRVNLTFRV